MTTLHKIAMVIFAGVVALAVYLAGGKNFGLSMIAFFTTLNYSIATHLMHEWNRTEKLYSVEIQ